MKAIHGGKAKNDKIDSQKIAVLLRGGMLPQAYVSPAEMRATRDLLRRRMHLARKRGELLAHVHSDVTIVVHTTDRYGRLVGEVLLPDGRSLTQELVKAGMA